MITFITGVPGSGKSLYVVSKLLKKIIGTYVTEYDDDDNAIKHKRVIYSNIRGLLLEHEFIDFERLKTWHEWCKPGDLIVCDECQKAFIRRPNGAHVPAFISELEEHRGKYSVDFIFMSQGPMLVDGHVLGLVGRHLHCRRVANLPLSIVYEWDHCSKSLLFKNSVTKSAWWYDRSAYKLYKSARVHTAQPRKIPGLVWFILVGICGAAFAVPNFVGRLGDRMNLTKKEVKNETLQKPQPVVAVKDGFLTTSETVVTAGVQSPDGDIATEPGAGLRGSYVDRQEGAPLIAGCISVKTKCSCVDGQGQAVEVKPGVCEARILGNSQPGQKADISALPAGPDGIDRSTDADVVAFMRKQARPSF